MGIGSEIATLKVCDQSTSMKQTSDQLTNSDSLLVENYVESKSETSDEKSFGSPGQRLDSDNGSSSPKPAAASSSASLGGTSSNDFVDANAPIASTDATTETISNEASPNERYNSCPSLVEIIEAFKKDGSEFFTSPPSCYSPVSQLESECNDSFTEECIGLIDESIERNVNSFEMHGDRCDADEPPLALNNSSCLEDLSDTDSITPSEAALMPNLPELTPDAPLLPRQDQQDFMNTNYVQSTPSSNFLPSVMDLNKLAIASMAPGISSLWIYPRPGVWYKCRNSHFHMINDYGDFNLQFKCPECGVGIFG